MYRRAYNTVNSDADMVSCIGEHTVLSIAMLISTQSVCDYNLLKYSLKEKYLVKLLHMGIWLANLLHMGI